MKKIVLAALMAICSVSFSEEKDNKALSNTYNLRPHVPCEKIELCRKMKEEIKKCIGDCKRSEF